jgi:endonuclease YncB( thermonuclease family)
MILVFLWAALALAGDPIPTEARVSSVYDGDTVTLETGDKVRLRWVNTPEMRPLEEQAKEAKDAAERFVGGRVVKLIVEGDDPRDSYGRVVAGLRTDEGDLSEHLLELGLAHLFVIPPDNTDLSKMIAAQSRARSAKLGIWRTDAYQGALHITSFHANASGDDRYNLNGEYLRVCNISDGPVDLKGHALKNEAGKRFDFPPFVIPAGHTVKIHTGSGSDQRDSSKQLVFHLRSSQPVWNNDADRATLLAPDGRVVDSRGK